MTITLQEGYNPQTRPHPGETLAEKLEEMGLGPKEFALRTGKPEKTILAVLGGKSSITADMAIQFELATEIPAHFWMNHQRSYDEFKAREKHQAVIKAAIPWMKCFPYEEMVGLGWLPLATNQKDKTHELLRFFGIADHRAWENYYLRQKLKVTFGLSLKGTEHPHALSAWLRLAEVQAQTIFTSTFSLRKFKADLKQLSLGEISTIEALREAITNFCTQQSAVVLFTPPLSKLTITGAVRWHKKTPVFQLSAQITDVIELTKIFYHLVGHVVLHGKKDVFLEGVEYVGRTAEKEAEAEAFAEKEIKR